jgi:DNA-binding transcriptional ArsR family regulator
VSARHLPDEGNRRASGAASGPDSWRSGRRRPRRRLPDEAVELIAAELKVMAEPNRIRLLELLNEGEASVQELTDRLATTHANVSKHLAVLHRAGMVSRRREGNSVRYVLIEWSGWWVVEQVGRALAARLDELRDALAPEQADSERASGSDPTAES